MKAWNGSQNTRLYPISQCLKNTIKCLNRIVSISNFSVSFFVIWNFPGNWKGNFLFWYEIFREIEGETFLFRCEIFREIEGVTFCFDLPKTGRSTADFYQNAPRFVNKIVKLRLFRTFQTLCFLSKLDFATYFILSMMYLSGISPSWPRTEPFHQSLETCLKSTMVSPLWKLTSRVERALKSYNAWATNVSGSAKEKKKYVKYSGKLKG